MAPLSGKMHIMLFFNNTSKVKEGPLNLSCELIWGFGSDHWSECFFIDEWMIWSIYALLPWTLWLILPVFSHRQRSMLTADEAGITGLPQKSCTFSFLSFVFDPLTRFVHFAHFSFTVTPWTSMEKMKCWWGRKLLCRDCLLSCFELTKCNVKWEGESLKRSESVIVVGRVERPHRVLSQHNMWNEPRHKAWQIYIYGLPMHRAIFYFINAKVKHKDSPNYKYDLASALINNKLFHFHFHCQRKEVFHLLPVLFVIRPLTV